MTSENIRAADVRVGDRVYDADFYGPNKWRPVQAIESMPPYVMLDLGYVKIGKHEREGVAVIRDDDDYRDGSELSNFDTGRERFGSD